VDNTSISVNTSSLVNILTLRYDSGITPNLPKINHTNFSKHDSEPSLEKIEQLIEKNIRSKIPSNVDSISIALSGGVDSTLILGLIRKIFPKLKINAISVKFQNSVDESLPASKIANFLDAKHHVIEIKNYLHELPKAISIIKQPFWDTHWYYVTKKAKTLSKFLATGDGGDEIFGGYTFRYKKFLELTYDNSSVDEKITAYLKCHERDSVPDQDKIFHKNIKFSWNSIHKTLYPFFDNDLQRLDQVMLADYNGKLLYNFSIVNNSLQKYFKLESISPLLSENLISYMIPYKIHYKYNSQNNVGKLLLRKLLKKYKLEKFMTNEKLGFNANTVELWNSYGKKLCEKYLINGEIIKNNIINQKWIEQHIDNECLEIKYVNKFLGLLACEIWYQLFITKQMNPNTKLY
tara:strand:+ start:1405 stop:2622 length:1218 start_codon:yes stop_codon:yes gene_type:complete